MTEEDVKHRINNALILLKEGHSFKVGELEFYANNKNDFTVIGYTIKIALINITKKEALDELNDIKSIFNKMTQVSPELFEFIKGRQIEYTLGYDYGMGNLIICTEKKGIVQWEAEIGK